MCYKGFCKHRNKPIAVEGSNCSAGWIVDNVADDVNRQCLAQNRQDISLLNGQLVAGPSMLFTATVTLDTPTINITGCFSYFSYTKAE